MTREWGATGGGIPRKLSLSDATRMQIRYILKGRVEAPDQFFEELEEAIGRFHTHRDIAKRSRPAAVRENLKTAQKAALSLNSKLNALDGNSRQLLDEVVVDGVRALQGEHLAKIIFAISKAQKLAASYRASGYRKAGRLPETYRVFLAVDIAFALEHYLEVEPTTTKDGLFVAVLEVVMAKATGRRDATVHQLAKRALSSWERKAHHDGTVEYVPAPAQVINPRKS